MVSLIVVCVTGVSRCCPWGDIVSSANGCKQESWGNMNFVWARVSKKQSHVRNVWHYDLFFQKVKRSSVFWRTVLFQLHFCNTSECDFLTHCFTAKNILYSAVKKYMHASRFSYLILCIIIYGVSVIKSTRWTKSTLIFTIKKRIGL